MKIIFKYLDDDNKGYMISLNNFIVYSDETMSKVLGTQKNYFVFAFDDTSFRFEEQKAKIKK